MNLVHIMGQKQIPQIFIALFSQLHALRKKEVGRNSGEVWGEQGGEGVLCCFHLIRC